MLKRHGLGRVRQALEEVDRRNPRSPPAFFRAICEGREAKAADAEPPAPPMRRVQIGDQPRPGERSCRAIELQTLQKAYLLMGLDPATAAL
jgi:hypothetical protein